MKQIGIQALRGQLKKVLDGVERGGHVAVTRRGRVIARIVPADAASVREIIVAMKALREKQKPASWNTLRKLRDEGRR